jgi:hypothetical protein
VMGQAQAAMDKDADESFHRSLDLLRQHEPYEAERTQTVMQTLISRDERYVFRDPVEAGESGFDSHGAQHVHAAKTETDRFDNFLTPVGGYGG